MYLNPRNILWFSCLAGAALLSWYFSREDPARDRPSGRRDTSPLGYYLTDAALLGTDEDGRVLYRVWAGRAEERPDEDRLVLSDVRVEYQPALDVPWKLRAGSGEARTSESYLDLSGSVELAREPQDGGERTVVRTRRMRLEPETFVASTAEAVSVIFGDKRLDAVGMRVDLKDDLLELESDVHGEFFP
jgi:LPS export ABC transporter protein LptC